MTTSYEDRIKDRKKRNTRITSIVILSVVFAIAIFILISSLAMVGLNPKFVARPDTIYVYDAGKSVASGHITSEDEEYDIFMQYYDDMFSSSFLSAMFSGRLGGYDISKIETCTKGTLYKKFESNYVKFKYDEDNKQILTYGNGKEYKLESDSTKTFAFTELYFEVNDKNVANEFTIYVVDASTSESSQTKYVRVTLLANTSEIFNNFKTFKIS